MDALHRILWLIDNRPSDLPVFFERARPDPEQLRLVAQALSGPVLTARPTLEDALSEEMSALHKLNANWRGIMDDRGASRSPPRQLDGQIELALFGDD